jgi:hypothetical protein
MLMKNLERKASKNIQRECTSVRRRNKLNRTFGPWVREPSISMETMVNFFSTVMKFQAP